MTTLEWYRQDKAHVAARLAAGERPQLAMTTATGPLDEVVALHDELGAMAAVAGLPTDRHRPGLDDALLLRTLAVLPVIGTGGFRCLTEVLFGEPAVLLRLGWSPVQLRRGASSGGWSAAPSTPSTGPGWAPTAGWWRWSASRRGDRSSSPGAT